MINETIDRGTQRNLALRPTIYTASIGHGILYAVAIDRQTDGQTYRQTQNVQRDTILNSTATHGWYEEMREQSKVEPTRNCTVSLRGTGT